jgi:hypothetical protein
MVRSVEWVRALQLLIDDHERNIDKSREATPSFALLDVQGPVIVTYVYQLVDGEVSLTSFFQCGRNRPRRSCLVPLERDAPCSLSIFDTSARIVWASDPLGARGLH